MRDKDDFLRWGYQAGIILAFLGIIGSAVYLFVFIYTGPQAVDFDTEIRLVGLTADRRLRLLSTAIFVGMSFGFLGFSLFLIQAKGDVDVEGSKGDYKINIARLSPGLFVILCATVIIVVCATFRIGYELQSSSVPPLPELPDIDTSLPAFEPDSLSALPPINP
ncbi:MAG: hypothetical protein CMP48_25435 [Rickettsiales bacterium]|nr:hypothetical protein [Rickettsiales bacterium]